MIINFIYIHMKNINNYISGDIETACNAFIDDLDPKFYKSLNK